MRVGVGGERMIEVDNRLDYRVKGKIGERKMR